MKVKNSISTTMRTLKGRETKDGVFSSDQKKVLSYIPDSDNQVRQKECEVVELNNEIWVQILKRLPKYNPDLGSPTTFIRCDITHAICAWVSYEKYHASPYYANRLETS